MSSRGSNTEPTRGFICMITRRRRKKGVRRRLIETAQRETLLSEVFNVFWLDYQTVSSCAIVDSLPSFLRNFPVTVFGVSCFSSHLAVVFL